MREGVYDKVYLNISWSGGPGSGKTFVTRSTFVGTGLKLVNSDVMTNEKSWSISKDDPDEEEYFRNIVRIKMRR